MKESSQRQALHGVYDAFARWAERFSFACRKGCATCCTQSVTMTSLEAEDILAFAGENAGPRSIVERLALRKSQVGQGPPQTTNEFVRACLEEREPAAGQGTAWRFEPCPFLEKGICSIYPARPFMCRCFASTVDCDAQGSAAAAPVYLTAGVVAMQIIEHLDSNGTWGNMLDVLELRSGGAGPGARAVRPTMAIPGFYVPPEERRQVQELLALLHGVPVQGTVLETILEQAREQE